MTVRWKFEDRETDEIVYLPINPREMSSPTIGRQMQYAWGSSAGRERIRAIDLGVQQPTTWTFTGVILTKSHYDLLLEWADRLHVLRVTDHLDRTFEIIIQKFDPIERLPTATRSWRADYTMECLLLKELQ